MPALMRKPPLARADRQAAEAAGIAEKARTERDQAGEQAAAAVRAAEAELARARQAEAGAREQARQAREDAAREREALAGQYQARLQAAGSSPQPSVTAPCVPSSAWTPSASAMTACSLSSPPPAGRGHSPLRAVLAGRRPGVLVPAARPGTRHEHREGARAGHHIAACAAPLFDTRTGKSPARRLART